MLSPARWCAAETDRYRSHTQLPRSMPVRTKSLAPRGSHPGRRVAPSARAPADVWWSIVGGDEEYRVSVRPMMFTVFTKPWKMPLPELARFVRGLGFDGV